MFLFIGSFQMCSLCACARPTQGARPQGPMGLPLINNITQSLQPCSSTPPVRRSVVHQCHPTVFAQSTRRTRLCGAGPRSCSHGFSPGGLVRPLPTPCLQESGTHARTQPWFLERPQASMIIKVRRTTKPEAFNYKSALKIHLTLGPWRV